jgi:hypothetical protein
MTSPMWHKSSRSTQGTTGDCVEVAKLSETIGVRDSKQPEAGHLSIDRDQFTVLVERVKRSELDL